MHSHKKNIIYLLIFLLFLSFSYLSYAGDASTYNEDKPSFFQKTKTWWNKHKPGGESELRELKKELKAKEELLKKVETGMANIVKNARPKCANGTVSVSFENDPRIELRNELSALRIKIKKLEH